MLFLTSRLLVAILAVRLQVSISLDMTSRITQAQSETQDEDKEHDRTTKDMLSGPIALITKKVKSNVMRTKDASQICATFRCGTHCKIRP